MLQQGQLRKDAQTKITTNCNVKQTDKLGPKAAQSFVILPQGYRKTGIPDERMFGGDTLPDHEVRKRDRERERERERERGGGGGGEKPGIRVHTRYTSSNKHRIFFYSLYIYI